MSPEIRELLKTLAGRVQDDSDCYQVRDAARELFHEGIATAAVLAEAAKAKGHDLRGNWLGSRMSKNTRLVDACLVCSLSRNAAHLCLCVAWTRIGAAGAHVHGGH